MSARAKSHDPGHPAYEVLRTVSGRAGVVLAANPSPMTLAGTNTWLLRDRPERDEVIVVDPGPADPAHLDAVVAAGRVVRILLTHGHPDHSAGARSLHERTGAPVLALDPRFRHGGEGLHGGDVVTAAGIDVRVQATPGHTADSLCFVIDDRAEVAGDGHPGRPDRSVLTGDTVLGEGSSVIAEPDGDLGDYLASLRRLAELGPARVLPGHGPDLSDLDAVVARYLTHRQERLRQVRAALDDLGLAPDPASAGPVVRLVYAEVARELWPAAEQSVRAQLAHLRAGRA